MRLGSEAPWLVLAQQGLAVGYHLAQMRKQRGMTQAEVARAMGVSQARVSRMEHGTWLRIPGPAWLTRCRPSLRCWPGKPAAGR